MHEKNVFPKTELGVHDGRYERHHAQKQAFQETLGFVPHFLSDTPDTGMSFWTVFCIEHDRWSLVRTYDYYT